LAIL
jgi:hypothetical protein